MNNLDLKQTERDSFKLATYADGLNDISLGLVMILMGIYPLTRDLLGVTGNVIFSLAALAVIFVGQVWAKKRLAPSRIGLVTLGERTQKRLKTSLLIGLILFFLTVGTWYLSAQGYFLSNSQGLAWLGSYGLDILVAGIVLLIFSGIAYTMEMTRYYLYGLLLGATFPLQNLPLIYQGVPYFISGAVVIGIGIYLLSRILHKYPVIPAEMEVPGD